MLSSDSSSDSDGHVITSSWMIYPEASVFARDAKLSLSVGSETKLIIPKPVSGSPVEAIVHVILTIEDYGNTTLATYYRAIITLAP
jgi:hypothetical protein